MNYDSAIEIKFKMSNFCKKLNYGLEPMQPTSFRPIIDDDIIVVV